MPYSLLVVLALLLLISEVQSFSFVIPSCASNSRISSITQTVSNESNYKIPKPSKATLLYMNTNGDDSKISEVDESGLTESDQTILGVVGISMSILMLYSEYVLKMTGRGLPAGPFGLIGAIEGLSYLGVPGLVAFSVFTKIKTGNGLPAGKYGLLGAAEGVSFLAVLGGIVILVLQVSNTT